MDRTEYGFAVVLLIVAVASVPVVGAPPTTAGGDTGVVQSAVGDGSVEVSDCRTISSPGRYVLTEDIENSTAEGCINITASDVVFDGRGHTLDAREVDHPTEAIVAGYTDPPIENVTIKNLVVTDWVQGVGCRAVAANVTIDNVTARRNGLQAAGDGYGQEAESYGIYVGEMTHNVTITDSVAVNNSQGIAISNTSNNVVRGNLVRDNTAGGIVLEGDTWRNRIVDNHIVANAVAGITVRARPGMGAASRTMIRGNVVRDNERGVWLEHTNTTVAVVDNRLGNTTRESIWVAVVDGNVTIAENSIAGTSGDGIVLDATNDVIVRNNTVRDVRGAGIRLKHESRGNVLENNRVVGTSGDGIRLDGARDTVLADVTVRDIDGHAVEAGADPSNVTVRNLSLASGRVSLVGPVGTIASVPDIPEPPAGRYDVEVAVRLRDVGSDTDREGPAVLTVYHPEAASNVTLWRWADDGTWMQVDDATAHPARNALSTRLADTGDFLVVPLAPVPLHSSPPTATATPDPLTPTGPGLSNTTTTTGTAGTTPGLGVAGAVLALLALLALLADSARARP